MSEALELKVESKMANEKIEKELLTEEKVTEEKVESTLNYELLSQEEKDAIDEFCQKIDVNDSVQVLQFGSAAQNKISSFSDSVLESVKTKNAGEMILCAYIMEHYRI